MPPGYGTSAGRVQLYNSMLSFLDVCCPLGRPVAPQVGSGPWNCTPPVTVACNGASYSNGSVAVSMPGTPTALTLSDAGKGAAGNGTSQQQPVIGLVSGWRYTFSSDWGECSTGPRCRCCCNAVVCGCARVRMRTPTCVHAQCRVAFPISARVWGGGSGQDVLDHACGRLETRTNMGLAPLAPSALAPLSPPPPRMPPVAN